MGNIEKAEKVGKVEKMKTNRIEIKTNHRAKKKIEKNNEMNKVKMDLSLSTNQKKTQMILRIQVKIRIIREKRKNLDSSMNNSFMTTNSMGTTNYKNSKKKLKENDI